MATTAYYNWVKAGRPWKVMRPVKALGDRLRGYGYTVYYLGSDDTSHLQAATPQDHCPFSVTGWPVAHPYPYVAALDIMPPRAGSGLPSLQQLGARMSADRTAGVPGISWLKYQNWEPDQDNGGRCWQDSWKPSHVRTTSSDRGHIHMSARSDMAESAVADLYDPVARIRGLAEGDPDMALEGIDKAQVNNAERYSAAIFNLSDKAQGISNTQTSQDVPSPFTAAFKKLAADVAEIKGRAVLDPTAVAAAMVKDTAFITTLAAAVAAQVTMHAGATADEVRKVVDEELDEQSLGGADKD